MSIYTAFNEGKNYLGANGLPANVYFFLSTKPCPTDINAPVGGEHNPTDTLVGAAMGEITGTGYARKTQTEPSPTGGNFIFSTMTWNTGAATDWQSPKSIVASTTADNTGVAICAWNLIAAGTAVNLGAASTPLAVTPGLLLRSLGEI